MPPTDQPHEIELGNYRVRVTRLTVLPKWEPIFSERATHVEIEDESAGEFLKVTQIIGNTSDAAIREVRIEPGEWPAIRHAIERLMPINSVEL